MADMKWGRDWHFRIINMTLVQQIVPGLYMYTHVHVYAGVLNWRYGATIGARATYSGVKQQIFGARAPYMLLFTASCSVAQYPPNDPNQTILYLPTQENLNACMAIAMTEHTLGSLPFSELLK